MILSYGARNFFCFKEWASIDLEFNKNVPIQIANNKSVAPVLCFKGANAAGKTNGLKILAFITDFCKNSFRYMPNSDIPFETFFNNQNSSDFFLEFRIGDITYRYELSAYKKYVVKEKLSLPKRRKILLQRTLNSIEKNNLYTSNSEILLRSNASIISTLWQYGVKEVQEILFFLEKISSNVSYFGFNLYFDQNDACHKWYYDHPEDLDYVKTRINEFDTGIEDIKIETKPGDSDHIIYYPVFYHKTRMGLKPLSLQFESSGTQWLYKNLVFFAFCLRQGNVLLMDELDLNLHSDLLPELVGDFLKPDVNKNNAQLLFTTHNDNIMEIAKKYQIYIFNKENGESYCYRLDELPSKVIRNDRSIKSLYEKGLLGGVPKLHG